MKREDRKKQIENNNRLFLTYNKYKLLSLNMFRWEGLPETIKSRHIESALFNYGLCIIIDDPDLGYISVPCNFTANMNINYEPTQVATCGYNYIKTINYMSETQKDKCQLILNNDLAIGNEAYIYDYAIRMYEVEQCIRANINQQKFPWFVNADPKTKLTLETMFRKVDNFEPFILANKQSGIETLEVLTSNTPYVADKLNEYKFELEREILTFHGLNNNFEKKERLLTNEVDSNNDYIARNVDVQYKNRLKAAEEMNKKFGWNVKVINLNQEQKEKDLQFEIKLQNQGGEENE